MGGATTDHPGHFVAGAPRGPADLSAQGIAYNPCGCPSTGTFPGSVRARLLAVIATLSGILPRCAVCEAASGEGRMSKTEVVSWVVYRMTVNGQPVGLNAVCEQG